MNKINKCEVCGNNKLHSVLDLGYHPMCDDLVQIDDERACEEYPIEILFCDNCFTAHQKYQVPKQLLFTSDYHYRARMTGSVLSGMSDLVESCAQRLGSLEDKVVLDIGCNDGSLLNFFEEKGCKTIGVEPTGAALDSKHLTINEFFDSKSAARVLDEVGAPDIIVFTNVFAHIEDLPSLLDNLENIMGEKTVLVVENHYLGAVLDYSQFDTFYHEHPRTYSYESFKYIAKTLGRVVQDVQFVSRYGGNIRVYIGSGKQTDIAIDESGFYNKFVSMNNSLNTWRIGVREKVNSLVAKHGKLQAKAFPGRAAILIKLLGLDENHISAVYEIRGSIKVGHYVPGTRIPIYPEADLYSKDDQSQPILNLAWHLPKEVRANLKKNGYVGEVIDIKEFRSEATNA